MRYAARWHGIGIIVFACILTSADSEEILVRIRSGPPDLTSHAKATFSFVAETAASAGFECNLDGGIWSTCSSPHVIGELQDGMHSFQVRATSGDGAPAGPAASRSWTVDTQPPSTEIHTGPSGVSASTSATFQFVASELLSEQDQARGGEVMCQLDRGGFNTCSSPMTYTGLQEGEHSFVVRITDSAGNQNESSLWSWSVDVPPTCQVSFAEPAAGGLTAALTAPFGVRFHWSEAVQEFGPRKVSLDGVGGTLEDWKADADGKTFTATVRPRADGKISVKVLPGAGKDKRGQSNAAASNTLAAAYDGTPPKCSVSGPSGTHASPFQVSFEWSENVGGFNADRVVLEGAAMFEPDFTASDLGSRFTGTVTPLGSGEVRLYAREGAATDLAGGASLRSNTLTLAIANSNLFVSLASAEKTLALGADREVVGTMEGVFAAESALEVDSAGSVYVGRGGEVAVYAGWGAAGGGPVARLAGFKDVAGLDVHDAKSQKWLFVSDAGDHRVKIFTKRHEDEWELLSTIGSGQAGKSSYALDTPKGVEFDASTARLYVADSGNRRVQVFDLAGDHLGGIEMFPDDPDRASAPAHVEVDGAGRVLVADPAAGRVAVFDRAWAPLGALGDFDKADAAGGEGGTGRGRVRVPVAVEADRHGAVYVADAGARVLHVFDRALAYVGPQPGAEGASAVGVYRDEVAPNCTLSGPEGEQHGPFEVTIVWSEQVVGFSRSDVQLGGAGGEVVSMLAHGSAYTATVQPAGVGLVTVKVVAGSVSDSDGNLNAFDSNTVAVTYFAGQCSNELGCQWQLAMYQHELALDRLKEESHLETQRAVEVQRVVEKAAQRREEMKLDAEAQTHKMRLAAEAELAELERHTIQERAQAEADQRIREARATEDLDQRKAAGAARETRATVLAAVDAVFGYLGSGAQELLNDRTKLQTVVGVVAAMAVSIYCAREFASAMAGQIKRWLGQPALVRYSSRSVLPWAALRIWMGRSSAPFSDVVLEDKLLDRMQKIATSTLNTKQRGAPFRNLLLYGMPGTGKTMVAERLAKSVGMDYAMMSGGDVVPLGMSAVSELHHLFDWAQASRRGVLLLMDEADAFLRSRDSSDMGEYMRSALNAVLSRTGVQSSNFMLVLVTNRPDDLDPAVMDRMDELVEFPPPEPKQRISLLKMYLNMYIPQQVSLTWKHSKRLAVKHKNITDDVYKKLSETTKGFSGRDLAKLMASVQAHVYGKDGEAAVTPEDLYQVAELKKQEHDRRLNGFKASEQK